MYCNKCLYVTKCIVCNLKRSQKGILIRYPPATNVSPRPKMASVISDIKNKRFFQQWKKTFSGNSFFRLKMTKEEGKKHLGPDNFVP